jgi:hypothetical protein
MRHRPFRGVQSGTVQRTLETVRWHQVNTMIKNMTRSKLIRIWFSAVALVVVAGMALGTAVTIGTGALLLTMCLVPPLLVVMLWPSGGPPTIAEVIHDAEGPK